MKLLKEDWDWNGEVPKIAVYINDQFAGREEITRDEFEEAFEDAIMGLLGELPDYDNQTVRVDKKTKDLWDLETDVRVILGRYGWETIYEGDNEGGLRIVSEEPTDYDRRAVEQDYGLEDGELDGVDIREAEQIIGEEDGALDRYINEELNTMSKKLNESYEDLRAELDKAIKALKSINPGVFYEALALYDMCGIEDLSKVSDKQLDELTDIADSVDSIYDEYVRAEIRDVCGDFVNESCKSKKKAKKLNETFAGEDSLQDLIERAKIKYNDDNTRDIDDIVWETIDEGLIYSRDIWNLAEHYGVIDDGELIERFYDDLYSDIKEELESYSGEEEEEGTSEDEEETSTNESLNESITVQLDEDEALDMLMNRVEEFGDYHPGDVEYTLYEKMYENAIDSGAFDNATFNVMTIVDNDIVNYCKIIGPGDDDYETIVDLYDTQGLGDISTESDYGYIEAVEKENGKNYFLLRY